MPKSEWLANKTVEHNMGRAAFPMPSTVFAALCKTAPSKTSTGSTIQEVSYTGYARVQVPAASISAAAGGAITNLDDIEWPEVQAGSDNAVAVAFLTAASGGNMLYYDPDVGVVGISTTQTPPVIRAGVLTISED